MTINIDTSYLASYNNLPVDIPAHLTTGFLLISFLSAYCISMPPPQDSENQLQGPAHALGIRFKF